MDLNSATRLGRPMAALWPTRRLVGKQTHPFKLIAGQCIGHRLQGTCVIGSCHTVRTICSTIQKRTEVHRRQCPIPLNAGFDPHFDGMASPVNEKHLLTGTGDLDRPTRAARQFTGTDFMREWIGLATEATSYMRRNHPYMRHWQFQDLAQLTMHIMRRLCRRPQRHLATHWIAWIGLPPCYTCMCFQWRMRVALIIKPILTNVVCRPKPRFHITKFISYRLMNIANPRILINLHLW